MSEPFLILHKVRGQPAFDIAERWEFDGEEGWIVSTSGHRAYPHTATRLDRILKHGCVGMFDERMSPDLPDHYASNSRPLAEDTYTVQAKAKGVLERLGLVKKVKVERRD